MKTQQWPVILELCLRKFEQGNQMIIAKTFCIHTKTQNRVFKVFRFEKRFRKVLGFHNGLVWTVGLTVEI